MKKFFLIILTVVLLGSFYSLWLVPKYVVPILTYHSIGYGKGNHFVTPENFAKQMEYIKKKGYEVITLDELVRGIRDKKHFKRNKVVITFDDGYKDNFKYAYPVLKNFNFPATIFIIHDLVGKSVKESEFLNWEEIITMSANNISFGSHTKTHFYLGVVKDEKAAFDEISSSKIAIEQKINLPVDYFCYPGGGFNEQVKEMVSKSGYKGACATNRGFADFNKDVYELKRIKITNSDMTKPFSFWAKLSGYYNSFRRFKKPY